MKKAKMEPTLIHDMIDGLTIEQDVDLDIVNNKDKFIDEVLKKDKITEVVIPSKKLKKKFKSFPLFKA